jgi:D-alanyl-D-alanine carboxypeptidase/D-alanyl-D-alanine-endopeptidase (penicillin-binding protein 4)
VSPHRRSVSPIVVLIALALLPGVVLFALWRWATSATAGQTPPPTSSTVAPTPSPVLRTPLLSFRRTPGVLSRDVNLAPFEAKVAEFAATLDAPSCVDVSVDGVSAGSVRADVPLIPASNQKLLVGAVALEVLGPGYRFTTEVRAGAGAAAGVVAGDLYLVGGGDPLLTSSTYPVRNDPNPVTTPTSLDALADALAGAGITQIQGGVVGDASRYDDEFFAPSWVNDVRGIEAGPYDALMVNDSRVTGDPQRATNPALAAATELSQLLAARHVAVAAAPSAGTAPVGATVLGSVQSAPMTDVVAEMLSTSDNNTAELLLKELGLVKGGAGTRDAGIGVVTETLAGWGLPMTGVVMADGSGLSNDDRVTCQLFAGLLARHAPTDPLGAALPVAGQSGTLAGIFSDSPLAGRMRAKTGTLGNAPYNADPPAVKSLSGYVPLDGGGAIEFSLILNAPGTLTDQSVYRPIWDRLAAVLATYPSGATPAQLAPR